MSMTREEAFKRYEEWRNLGFGHSTMPSSEVLVMAMNSLRPITREQVEKIRGEWIDIDGETVPVDKYGQTLGWAECSACGQYLTASDEYPCTGHFCPNCGAPMTDEAVQMVMERLEAMYGEAKAD